MKIGRKKEKYILGILFAYTKNKKAKVKAVGETLSLMTLFAAVSKCLVEKISEEKGVSSEQAENIVIDCIKDGMKTIND